MSYKAVFNALIEDVRSSHLKLIPYFGDRIIHREAREHGAEPLFPLLMLMKYGMFAYGAARIHEIYKGLF